MTPRVLTVDAGTTSVKVCLFTPDLKLKAKSVREYGVSAVGRTVEADAETYLGAIRSGVREVGGLTENVAAVALTTQGETLTVTDADGVPLRPFIVWLDARADTEAEELRRLLPDSVFYGETGLPALTGTHPLAKALWLKRHEPGLFAPGHKLLLLEDFLLRFMTGLFVTEKTLQTSSGWFSLRRDGLWPEALAAAGLTGEMFPDMLESGDMAGRLLPGAASALGLPAGIPVFAGAMDQVAASYAMHVLFPGTATETTGTALVAGAVLDSLGVPGGAALPRTTIYRHALPGRYMLLPIGNTGGMSLTWFRDRFCPGTDYDEMDRLAAASPPGADGLLFLPFLDGSSDPDFCPEARGVFFGASLSMGREHFARAVMEGVAHLLRDMLEIMDLHGAPRGTVCSLGGGARSPLWEQIKADVCGREFITLECGEAPSLGAALLALRGAGLLPPGGAPPPPVAARYVPGSENRLLYDRAHKKYLSLYQAVKPLF